MKEAKVSKFERELQTLINRYSMEQSSDTPDFILAQYLVACLNAFNAAIQDRSSWCGVSSPHEFDSEHSDCPQCVRSID